MSRARILEANLAECAALRQDIRAIEKRIADLEHELAWKRESLRRAESASLEDVDLEHGEGMEQMLSKPAPEQERLGRAIHRLENDSRRWEKNRERNIRMLKLKLINPKRFTYAEISRFMRDEGFDISPDGVRKAFQRLL